MREVPKSTSLRFKEETRRKGVEESLKRIKSDNLSEWIIDAIDMRLYLEGRGIPPSQVLSGELLSNLESNPKDNQKIDSANNSTLSNGLDFSNPLIEELIKTLLRTHAMSKQSLKMLASNPNINNAKDANSYQSTVEGITNASQRFYDSVFKSDK